MTQLQLDLEASWGDFHLRAQLDADLQGVTAVFGPNGSGKTSILSAIAGFRPGSGNVTLGGEVWQDARTMRPAHRRVGMVFQDGRLFDHLNVADNLKYAARRANRDGPEIQMDQVVAELDLKTLLDRRPGKLAGGERQRVAIARALLTRPRLMLMDEPLAALDRVRKAALLPLIGALPERFGMPVLIVSHQIDEIVQIADGLITVRDGKITDHGPLAAMIDRMDPAISGRFEAGSVLEGKITRIDTGHAMAAIEVAGVPLWMPNVGGAEIGDPVRLRIRARDVSLATSLIQGISIRNQIPATVTEIETDDGAFAEVRLECAGQRLRARVSRLAIQEMGLGRGQPVIALIKSIAFDRRFSRG